MTKLYLSRGSAAYVPATIRGAWNKTSDGSVIGLYTDKDHPSAGVPSALTSTETNAASGYKSLVLRAVSAPLSADHNFGGTLDVMLGVQESSTNADFAYFLHVFVTQGNSDFLRGTLLENYAELVANEWPTSAVGRSLASAQSLNAVSAVAGDRIVAEIGFVAYNTTTLSRTGTIYHGGGDADLAASGSATGGVGFLDFSDTFALSSNPVVRASQYAVETLHRPVNANARLSQLPIETLRRPSAPRAILGQSTIEVLRRNGAPPPTGAQNNMIFVIAS